MKSIFKHKLILSSLLLITFTAIISIACGTNNKNLTSTDNKQNDLDTRNTTQTENISLYCENCSHTVEKNSRQKQILIHARWEMTGLPIKYKYFHNNASGPNNVDQLIREAFDMWEAVIPLNFIETQDNNWDISIVRTDILAPGKLGHTDYWYNFNDQIVGAEIKIRESKEFTENHFRHLMAHEIGHAIGCQHNLLVQDTIMYESSSSVSAREHLSIYELFGIQFKYGNHYLKAVTGNLDYDNFDNVLFIDPDHGKNYSTTTNFLGELTMAGHYLAEPTSINSFNNYFLGKFFNDRPDSLFMINNSGTNRFAVNNYFGGFTSIENDRIPVSSINGFDSFNTGDFNADGIEDIFASNLQSGENRLFINNGQAYFSTHSNNIQQGNINGFTTKLVADFNGDNRDDIFCIVPLNGLNRWFFCQSDLSFAVDTNRINTTSINDYNRFVVGNFSNNSSTTDIFAMRNTDGENRLFINNGNAIFGINSSAVSPNAINPFESHHVDHMVACDINNDNLDDIIVLYGNGLKFYLVNSGNHTFEKIEPNDYYEVWE